MIRWRELWNRIIRSRALAGIGVVALFFVGGGILSSLASAQGVTYTTITTADVNSIQQQINGIHNRVTSLESRVNTLETQVRSLQADRQSVIVPKKVPVVPYPGYTSTNYSYPTYTYTSYPIIQPVTTAYDTVVANSRVVIDQNGGRYLYGYDLYFTGRGFAPNEQIVITRNGVVVGHATADGSGGFSSNGVFLPFGTSAFLFTGQTSGVSVVATVRGTDDVMNP